MADNRVEFSRDDLHRLIRKLDAELARRGQAVAMYVVGGANISLAIDATRTTADIDVVVKNGFESLRRAAATVASTEPGVADDWINTEFTGGDNPTGGLFWRWFDHRDEDSPSIIFTGEGLIVEAASPEMMLALKTLGNRDQDIIDAFTLMRITGIRTPHGIGQNLARFTGRRIFDAQATDGFHPRIDPEFAHLFNNLPDDLRAQDAERAAGRDNPGPNRGKRPRCGAVKAIYRNGVVVSRTPPCTRRQGHLLPHRFKRQP